MALTFNDEQEAELLKLLGLPEAAPGDTDAGLTLDTITDLAAQVEAMDPVKPSTVAAAAKRNGMELIDEATAAALRRDAAEARTIKAAAAHAKVETAVEDAINTGRITPGRKKHWMVLCQRRGDARTPRVDRARHRSPARRDRPFRRQHRRPRRSGGVVLLTP